MFGLFTGSCEDKNQTRWVTSTDVILPWTVNVQPKQPPEVCVSDMLHVPMGRQSHLALSHTVQVRFYTTALLRGLSAAGQKNTYQKTPEDNESTDAKDSYRGSKAAPEDF